MIFGKKKKTYLSIFLTQSRALISYLDFDRKTSVLVEKFESEVADTAEFAKFLESVLEEIKKKYSDIPKQAIFFLSSFYIDNATRKVKKAFMKEFLDIFENLSLKGIGYIETQEAVAAEREKFKVKTASYFVFVELESDRAIATLLQDKHVVRSASAKILGEKLSAIKEAVGEVIGSYKPLFFIFTLYEGGEGLKKSLREKHWLKSLNLPENSQLEFVEMSRLNELLLELFQAEVQKEEKKKEESPIISSQKKTEEKKNDSSLPFGFSEADVVAADDNMNFDKQIDTFPQMSFSKFSFSKIFGGLSMFVGKFNFIGKGRFVLIGGLVFALLLLFFVHSYFIHTLVLKVVPVSKDINLVQELDEETLASLAEYKEKEIDIQASVSTSGNKEVGEKARGEISVYNFSTKDFSLSKGEKIKIKGKDFVILSSVDLPPAEEATVGGSIVKKPAVKKTQIEAVEIGEEYNLSTSEKIKIRDLDTDLYYAKLEGSTKGGSKEDLNTVARSDLESLREEVRRKASEDPGVENINEDGRFIYIPELNKVEIADEEFDKELGEVADQVSLNARVQVRISLLSKERLLEYLKKDLQDKLPEGFSYNSDYVNIEYEKLGDDPVSFQVEIQLKAFKDIDLDKLRSELTLKPFSYLQAFSEKNPDIERIEVLDNKSFLPFFNFTPANSGNIQLVL